MHYALLFAFVAGVLFSERDGLVPRLQSGVLLVVISFVVCSLLAGMFFLSMLMYAAILVA